jgi:hypothetical protein
MKKTTLILALVFAGSATVMAQGGGQQRTVPERVQTVHAKIDSAFKLPADQLKKVDDVFTTYYTAQDKLRAEMQGGGDFQAMREKMQPLTEDRDKKLKEILGDEKFKTFKEGIEPTMRGGRMGGGPPRN